MDNYDITYKARQIVQNAHVNYFIVLVFIGFFGVIPVLVSNSFLTLIITMCISVINQGMITASKKVYEEKSEEVNTYEDGLFGIFNFSKLFSTYFIYFCLKLFIILSMVLISILLLGVVIGTQWANSFNLTQQIISNQLDQLVVNFISNYGVILIFCLLLIVLGVIIIEFIFECLYFPTFYLLNDGLFNGLDALKKAREIMRGHFWQLVRLKFSFFWWVILSELLSYGVISFFVDSTTATMLSGLLNVVISTYLYGRRYQMAMYIFYEEVLKEKDDCKEIAEESIRKEFQFSNISSSKEYNKTSQQKEEDVLSIKTSNNFNEHLNHVEVAKGFIYLILYFSIVSNFCVYLFGILAKWGKITDLNFLNAYLNVVVDGIYLFIALLMFKDMFLQFLKGFKEQILPVLPKFILKWYGIILLGSFAGNLIITLFNGASQSANQSGIETIFGAYPIPIFIATVLFAPIVEEIVFRYIIFRIIRKRYIILSHLISAFLFGFIHVSSQVLIYHNFSELIQIFPYFFMGLVFSLSYEKNKTIAAPITLHFLNNLIATLLIFFI